MADSPIAPINAVQVVKHEEGFGHYLSLGGEVRLAENLILHEAQVVAAVLNRHWDNFVSAFRRDKDAVEAEAGSALEAAGEAVKEEGMELEQDAAASGGPAQDPETLETADETPQHEGTPDAPATPLE